MALFRHLGEGNLVLETKSAVHFIPEEGQKCIWANVEYEAHTNSFVSSVKNL